MNIFIFYRGKSAPSARALHVAMKGLEIDGAKIVRGTKKSKYLKNMNFDYIINVGNSEPISNIKNAVVINNPKEIRKSANKKQARIRFKAKRIPAPTLWTSPSDIPTKEFPVVGRTTYHMKAKGFWYCRNRMEATAAFNRGATHFMKFIKNTREFRAHVFATTPYPKTIDDYIIAKLSEKVNDDKNAKEIIKNHDAGYVFKSPVDKNPIVLDEVRKLAKKVLHTFGLHYGGVDIIYSKTRKKAFVLEINTTPCLTDDNSTTVETYANKFIGMIENNET